MKIQYDDKSFTEIKLAKPGFVSIIIAAKDESNPSKLQVFSDTISLHDLALAIKDLGVQLPIV